MQEDLTQTRNRILYVLRRARRDFPDTVTGCASRNGSVFAWVRTVGRNRSEFHNKKMLINTYARLGTFCSEVLSRSVTDYLPDN